MPEMVPHRILIVDDEVPQMQALCETLADHGYATSGASTAEAALSILRTQNFELIQYSALRWR